MSGKISAKKDLMKSVCSSILQKAAHWAAGERVELVSRFESRFIKTVRTTVVLAVVLTLINALLVLKG